MSDLDDIPVCVEPGWNRCDPIANPGGQPYRLLWWSDDRIGFEHRCDRGERGTIICAPLLQSGHNVTVAVASDGELRPTVDPSVLCDDCGTHGFIVAGRWLGT